MKVSPGFIRRHEHGLVGLGAGIRLHVGESAVEQALGALDGERLGDVDELAAAIVAPARIALGVLVGHHRALRLEHGARDDVLRGDQLDLVLLAPEFERRWRGRSRDRLREAGRKEECREDGLRSLGRGHWEPSPVTTDQHGGAHAPLPRCCDDPILNYRRPLPRAATARQPRRAGGQGPTDGPRLQSSAPLSRSPVGPVGGPPLRATVERPPPPMKKGAVPGTALIVSDRDLGLVQQEVARTQGETQARAANLTGAPCARWRFLMGLKPLSKHRRIPHRRGATSANGTPCGSMACTIQLPPGTSWGHGRRVRRRR